MQGRAAVIHVLMGTESVPLLQRCWWVWFEMLCSMHNRWYFPCGFLYTNTSVHTVDMQRRHVGRGHVCMTGALRECDAHVVRSPLVRHHAASAVVGGLPAQPLKLMISESVFELCACNCDTLTFHRLWDDGLCREVIVKWS
jgi:hypothetical protein